MRSDRLLKAMNDQVKNELESYYIYLSMAAYFHDSSLDGMAHWMRCQAHEEMVHAMKIFDHILDRGGQVVLQDLAQLKTEWSSPVEAFQDAYNHEQFITGKISELTAIAREEKEFTSEPILSWFLDEQVEEEATSGKIAAEIEMVGNDKSALLMLDRELGSRAYPAGSPLESAGHDE